MPSRRLLGWSASSLGVRRVGRITPLRGRVTLAVGFAGALGLVQMACGGGNLPIHAVATEAGPNAALRPAGVAAAAPTPAVLGSDEAVVAVRAQAPPTTVQPPPPPPLFVPTDPSQWFNPRGQHDGTEGITNDLATLGITDNSPLYVNECWGRTWGASTSDHHASQLHSWACDLSIRGVQVPTPQADEAARRIASALGVQGWTGGNLVKTINGYRIQVLWRVADHFNHVHVGVRKI